MKKPKQKISSPCQALYPKCFGSTWIVVLIELGFNRRHWKLQVWPETGEVLDAAVGCLIVFLSRLRLKLQGMFFQQTNGLKISNSTTRVACFCLVKVLPLINGIDFFLSWLRSEQMRWNLVLPESWKWRMGPYKMIVSSVHSGELR